MAKLYEPDPIGIAEVARSPKMQAAMVAIATAGVSGVRAISPVVSGEYRAGFAVEPTTSIVGWKNEVRAAARIVNTVPYASAVERKHRILSRISSIVESG
ncbi:hypothetical protein [Glutamicibacter sp. TV12E]|uniref:hypothetical protein n=1 Tax=Glutamicibacter sp. TV12E TaxID=3446362 RepID=UPI0040349E3C